MNMQKSDKKVTELQINILCIPYILCILKYVYDNFYLILEFRGIPGTAYSIRRLIGGNRSR